MRAVRVFLFGSLLVIVACSRATTFTVSTTNDSGLGSLRQAITDANNNSGLDTIIFNITNVTASSVKTIVLSSGLPPIADPVIIDGYTQPNAGPNTLANADNATLLVELKGLPTLGAGLAVINSGSGSTVRGLVISQFGDGIDLSAGNCVIEGNFIGTDPSGLLARTNNGHGIQISGSNNRIGGTNPASRNLLSRNMLIGVFIGGGSSSNVVQGNFIGVDATGTNGLGNGGEGIRIVGGGATANLVGGTNAAARNVISANVADGAVVTFGPFGNVIQGNYVGTDATGMRPLGNHDGVQISASGSNSVIANVICANHQHGVIVDTETEIGSLVQGNFIGVDATGTNAMGNALVGVFVGSASGTTIGGTNAGAGNIIAHNGDIGVYVYFNDAVNNAILGNSIFDNGALGIDLQANSGLTPNDPGDTDDGPNHLQNFPLINSVVWSGGNVTLFGTLNSSNNAPFRVEFFGNLVPCDPSGNGEGQHFLGATNLVTDGSGNAAFQVTFTNVIDSSFTATATDSNGNTSEFSACVSTGLPYFTGISRIAGNVVASGRGGPTNATYHVLTSTNLESSVATWNLLLISQFDGSGGFAFTNAVNTGLPMLFYRLAVP